MGLFAKKTPDAGPATMTFVEDKSTVADTSSIGPPLNDPEMPPDASAQDTQNNNVISEEALEKELVTWSAVRLGGIASIGGFIFGYESGQISGMSPFLKPEFTL